MAELADERRLVKDALDELEVDAWVFEQDAGARSGSIEDTFLEEVEAADLYLGIFWKGYGSYTKEEYDRALELGKDRLVYEKRADIESKRDPRLQEFLDQLGRVETGVTAKWFETAEELRDYVKEDVARWQTRVIRQGRPVWTRRFGANLALTVASAVLAVLYYGNHLSPLLPTKLVVGGASLTLAASVAAWLMGKLAGREMTGWTRRFLSRRRSTAILGGLAAGLLLLSLMTSSFYLIPDGDLASAPARVLVFSSDERLAGESILEKQPVGRPYFGRWRAARIDLELIEPAGREKAETLSLYPGWSLHHRVPSDFRIKVVRVLRLAPMPGLNPLLTRVGARPSKVSLRILVNGEQALDIEDLRRQAILIGADAVDMLRTEDKVECEEAAAAELRLSPIPLDRQRGWIEMWCLEPRIVDGLALDWDDEIVIEASKEGDALFTLTVPAEPGGKSIRTVFLERAHG